LFGTVASAEPIGKRCEMSVADHAWLTRSLAIWRKSERVFLHLKPQPLPAMIMVDAQCTYLRSTKGARWEGHQHGAQFRLPDGTEHAIEPVSFASAGRGAQSSGFFVMTLPSVWQTAGVQSGLGLENLMTGVMLHELMHTRQFYFVNPMINALSKRYGFGEGLSDDDVQTHFATNPDYAADYAAERDALYAAAAAPTTADSRRLAGIALDKFRSRRAKWFVGDDAKWASVDEIFLTMEGLGQWLAYAWATSPRGLALRPSTAQSEIRRKRQHWTQDEGLGLFLVIDRLVPEWQKLAFAPKPELGEALLARAAECDDRFRISPRPRSKSGHSGLSPGTAQSAAECLHPPSLVQ